VVAASIEYRTADESPFPGAVQDVKAAVRWMRANAKRYGISQDVIGTLGGSSGAHMALLAGVSDDRDLEGSGGNNNVSSRVQAVVAMATPADLTRLSAGGQRFVAQFLNASLEQDPKLWARASPVNHVRAGGPSILLMHGTADESVLPEQSSRFAELYRKAGGQAELVLIPKAPHPFWNYMPWFEDTMNRAGTFLYRVAREVSESRFSQSDFQKLRWIEGAWRGSDGGPNAFYEIYHFVNDRTIEIQYFGNDETLSQIKRKGSVSLLNGAILHRDESGIWAATSVDGKSIHFEPKENANNSFSWERQSSGLWLARLRILDPQGKQHEEVYRMDRVKHFSAYETNFYGDMRNPIIHGRQAADIALVSSIRTVNVHAGMKAGWWAYDYLLTEAFKADAQTYEPSWSTMCSANGVPVALDITLFPDLGVLSSEYMKRHLDGATATAGTD
jgi:acetyl esterase/lipase